MLHIVSDQERRWSDCVDSQFDLNLLKQEAESGPVEDRM